jgi:two-component system cell cycle sensor histidine kinase/response regulator CckA
VTHQAQPTKSLADTASSLGDRSWYPLAVSVLFFGAALFVPDPFVGVLLLACGGGLVAMTVLLRLLASRATPSESGPHLDSLAEFIENDASPSFTTDFDGVVLSQNRAARDRFGPREGETLTRSMRDFFANPAAVLQRLRGKVQARGSAREDIVTRKGHVRLAVHQAREGTFLWRLEDLVERSGAGRGAESLSLPMLTASKTGTILFMNEMMRRLLGGRIKTLDGIFTDLPLVNNSQHMVQGTDGEVPVRVVCVEGSNGRQEVFLIPADTASDVEHVTADPIAPDVFDNVPVAMVKMTREGKLLMVNKEAQVLLGGDACAGAQLGQLVEGLGRSVRDWLDDAASGRTLKKPEVVMARNKDKDLFLQINLNSFVESGETVLVAVFSDATELKTLEAQFVQSQKMQAIGQLAGGVAHDFNNLLTAISGHCDLLLLRHDQGDPDYGDLVQINQNANRAASLVGQLLAFSRKQNLQPETLDLRDTLGELIHLLNRLVGEKITLTLEHDPALLPMKADKRQLEQVLMNLVVNARDAMPEGGEIRIETQMATFDKEFVRDRAVVPKGDYVVVKVVDEGVGISQDKLSKIFEPFFTTKRTGEGTGLGLSTAYGIVKQTGGYIFVDSVEGQGATFSLLFPVNDMADIPVVQKVEALKVPRGTKGEGVILLVEDEAPVRAFASRALRMRGYTVLEAENAEDALKTLEDVDLQIDVFVTDVIMPGMDGPSWVRKALVERPDVKVVFVSGYAEDSFADKQADIPNSVFLPKPFSLNQLTATVHDQIH